MIFLIFLFCYCFQVYNLKRLIKQPACYKNPDQTLSVNLILTNVPRMLQSKYAIETRLPDFYLITETVRRKTFKSFDLEL